MSTTLATRLDRLALRLSRNGIDLPREDVATLRRAERTLQRWGEGECGDSDDYRSTCIVRDEETGIPHLETIPHTGKARRVRIPDREAGALRRVAAVCRAHGIYYYHQTDPRGCALYVAAEPLTSQTYSLRGVACCDD